MTVEVATTIATLDSALPAATDPKSEGDDHIRLIKTVLKANVVSGPASSTDNSIPRFDGATGKLLQGSGVVVDDNNNVGVGTSTNPLNHQIVNYKAGANANYVQVANGATGLGASNGLRVGVNAAGNAEILSGVSGSVTLDTSGNLLPGTDNTQSNGSGSNRWSTIYAGTGTINTSDAREKTAVRSMAVDEIEAAKALSKEVGVYQFLDSVAIKGDKARHHIGMTVQRAIEIMEAHGLDPFAYGFICYDKWGEQTKEHAAVEAKDAVLDDEGNEIEPAVEAKSAWTEVTLKAGDRYSFRYDQLNLFIARGLEARLAALEAA